MADRDIKKLQQGKICNENFDWNNHEIEIDSDNLKTTDVHKSSTESTFLTILGIIRTIFCVALVVRIWRYISSNNSFIIKQANLNDILNIIIVYFGLFLLLALIFTMINYALIVAKLDNALEKYKSIGQLSVILFWLLIAFAKSKIVQKEALYFYKTFKILLKAGIITTSVCILVSWLMINFEDFFIKKSLKAKIRETEKTEKILRHMHRFRYGSIDDSSSSQSTMGCNDIICIDFFGYNEAEPENEDLENNRQFGTVTIKPPTLQNIKACLQLAKECFEKVSDGDKELSFEQFARMFSNTKQALGAFAYFDSDQDRFISKKEFRDTTVYFFRDREVLEQAIKSTKEFVLIIKRIISVLAALFLSVVYLLLFGVSLKDLVAVVLSLALAFNFVASGLLAETYRNVVMLLSHQFDIGDDVIVDSQDLRVFKVGLSSTSFINVHGGRIKYLNSDLWKQTIINMTKAPEKILVFSFTLPSSVNPLELVELKQKIHNFLIKKIFDYHDNFQLISKSSGDTKIDKLNCSLVLKCKGYKNKAKKFVLRVEFTSFLQKTLQELGLVEE